MTTTSASRLNATVRASIARASTDANAELFANTTVAFLDAIKQRCADWSDNEYKTATEILYGLLADCLKLYDEHFVNAHDAERKDWLDLRQVRFRHLGERAFTSALAFFQRFEVAPLDLLPLMRRMNALLDQGTRLLSGRTCIRKAYLRKAANGKEVLLALQAVLPPPELAASRLDQQEQAPAV